MTYRITLILLIFSQFVSGQLLETINEDFNYYSYQNDSELWFSSSIGWHCSDGKRIESYSTSDTISGLKGTWVQSDLLKGNDNELWTCTYEFICKYTEVDGFNCFQPIYQGDTINTEIKAIHFFQDKGELLFRFKHKLLLFDSETGKIKPFDVPLSNGQVYVSYGSDSSLTILSSPWNQEPTMEMWTSQNDQWERKQYDFSTCSGEVKDILISDFYYDVESLWLSTSKGLVKLDQKDYCASELFRFEDQKINFNKIKFFSGHLLVATDFNGILIFSLEKQEYIGSISSSGASLKLRSDNTLEVFESEDRFYVSFTDGNRIQEISKGSIKAEIILGGSPEKKEVSILVTSNEDYLVLSDREKYIDIFTKDLKLAKRFTLNGVSIIGDLEMHRDRLKYTHDHSLVEISFADMRQKILFEDQSTKINYVSSVDDNSYLIGVKNVRLVNSDGVEEVPSNKVLPSVARFLKMGDTYVSCSTTEVMLAYPTGEKVLEVGSYVTLMEKGRHDSELLVLTDGDLILLDLDSQELSRFSYENVKLGNIVVKNRQELIAWGEDGVYLIDETNSIRKIIHGKAIKSLSYFNEYYVYTTGKELHTIHEGDIIGQGIDSLKIHDSTYPYESRSGNFSIKYKYFQEPLTLDFTASSIIANENNYYSITYDDKNLEKEFHSYQDAITFNRFSQGKHKFEVQGYNEDGTKANKLSFVVRIKGPFYQQWWFFAIIGTILIGGTILYFRNREKRLKDKYILEQEISNLQKSALQAQMNPHFIFNCLNSIQSFIMKNDKENAMDYLGQFARLIRANLNASLTDSISLEEEVRTLENYLSLEKLRVNDVFDYDINVSQDLNAMDIFFPPMLVQPFVENAVIHGMNGKTEGGLIFIEFELDGENLLVNVIDNGGTRVEKKETEHKSVGVQITQKRLAHINKSSSDQFNVHMEQTENTTTVQLKVRYTQEAEE